MQYSHNMQLKNLKVEFVLIVLLVFLQVFCVANFFEQPVDPVVSQEEASPTSLQENPSSLNHYGSTDWIWGLKDRSAQGLCPLKKSERT